MLQAAINYISNPDVIATRLAKRALADAGVLRFLYDNWPGGPADPPWVEREITAMERRQTRARARAAKLVVTNLEGLRAKARVLSTCFSTGEYDSGCEGDDLAWSVIQDILRIR